MESTPGPKAGHVAHGSKTSLAARNVAAKQPPSKAANAAASAAASTKPRHPQIFAGCQLVFWDTAFIGPLVDAVKARGAKVAKEVELGVTTHIIATDHVQLADALQRLPGTAASTAEGLPAGIHFVRRAFLTQSNIKGQRLQESDFLVSFAVPRKQERERPPPSSSNGLAAPPSTFGALQCSAPSSSDAEEQQPKGPRVLGLKRARSDSDDEEDLAHASTSKHRLSAANASTAALEAAGGAAAGAAAAMPSASGSSRPTGRPRWGVKDGGRKAPPPAEHPEGALHSRGMAELAPQPLPEGTAAELTHVVSIDCEMVGYGFRGLWSQLAWVAIVNNEGHVLLDTFVAPRQPVTDWRTWVSGVRPSDVEGAPPFEEVRSMVARIISGRVLVGHAVGNDLRVLELRHPPEDVRDTATYSPLMATRKRSGGRHGQNLKALVKQELDIDIQEAEHSPVDDARATLYVYHKHRENWEEALLQKQG